MTEVGDPRPITPEGWDNIRGRPTFGIDHDSQCGVTHSACSACIKRGVPFDPVAKPEHYNVHPSGIQCIEITQHHNFCVGNALKYLWRQGLKAGEPSVKDLRKAIQYIEFEIKRLEKNK